MFVAGRSKYILLSNTKSLYSTVLPGKGISDESDFIERAMTRIREFMEAVGQEGVYRRFITPTSGSVLFAKALDRSVTGSMNDLIRHATAWLAEGKLSPHQVGVRLNDIPMSALKHHGLPYGLPRDVFGALVEQAGMERPMPDA